MSVLNSCNVAYLHQLYVKLIILCTSISDIFVYLLLSSVSGVCVNFKVVKSLMITQINTHTVHARLLPIDMPTFL